MLERELDEHLGYEKHRKGQTDNNRNGCGGKYIKTGYGEMEIQFTEKLTFDGFEYRTTRGNEALQYVLLIDSKLTDKKMGQVSLF